MRLLRSVEAPQYACVPDILLRPQPRSPVPPICLIFLISACDSNIARGMSVPADISLCTGQLRRGAPRQRHECRPFAA